MTTKKIPQKYSTMEYKIFIVVFIFKKTSKVIKVKLVQHFDWVFQKFNRYFNYLYYSKNN